MSIYYDILIHIEVQKSSCILTIHYTRGQDYYNNTIYLYNITQNILFRFFYILTRLYLYYYLLLYKCKLFLYLTIFYVIFFFWLHSCTIGTRAQAK